MPIGPIRPSVVTVTTLLFWRSELAAASRSDEGAMLEHCNRGATPKMVKSGPPFEEGNLLFKYTLSPISGCAPSAYDRALWRGNAASEALGAVAFALLGFEIAQSKGQCCHGHDTRAEDRACLDLYSQIKTGL